MSKRPLARVVFASALVVALFGGPAAHARFQFRSGWTKWILRTSPDQAAQVTADVGGIVLAMYGSESVLVYVPSAEQLKQRVTTFPIDAADDSIQTPGGSFTALTGIPASVPAEGRQVPYGRGVVGGYLIQFIGPIRADWQSAVSDLGVRFGQYQYIPYNSLICSGTPEQMASVYELPFVQFVDFWHPFEKGWLDFGQSGDPRIRLTAITEFIESDPATAAAARNELSELAGTINYRTIVFKASDWHRVLQNRLLLFASANGRSGPLVYSFWPPVVKPGDTVFLTGYFLSDEMVTFDGIPSPRVTSLEGCRIAAVVPSGVPSGPVDVVVGHPEHANQIYPGDSPGGLEVGVTSPVAIALSRGDLITGDLVHNCCFEGYYAQNRWLEPDGTLRALVTPSDRDPYAPGVPFIDAQQRLTLAGYRHVSRRDANFNRSGDGAPFLQQATSVVVDRAGDFVAALPSQIVRARADGTLLQTVPIEAEQVSSLDLSADQCTVVYVTWRPGIRRVNLCTGEALPLVAGAANYGAVRFAPDRSLLAAAPEFVDRYDAALAPVAHVAIPNDGYPPERTAVAFSPDATFAWLATGRELFRYTLATNTLSAPIELNSPGHGTTVLVVWGGWTAARGFAPRDVAISSVTVRGDGFVEVHGEGFIDGVTVTVAGRELVIDERTETYIRGHLRNGSMPSGVVTVTAPNGQAATATTVQGVPTLELSALILFAGMLAAVAMRTLRA